MALHITFLYIVVQRWDAMTLPQKGAKGAGVYYAPRRPRRRDNTRDEVPPSRCRLNIPRYNAPIRRYNSIPPSSRTPFPRRRRARIVFPRDGPGTSSSPPSRCFPGEEIVAGIQPRECSEPNPAQHPRDSTRETRRENNTRLRSIARCTRCYDLGHFWL